MSRKFSTSDWVGERGDQLAAQLASHLATLRFKSADEYRRSDLRQEIKQQVFRRRHECEVCNAPAEEVEFVAFLTGRVDLLLSDLDGSDTSKLVGLCRVHWWQATHKDGYGSDLNMVQVSTKIKQMQSLSKQTGGTDLTPWTPKGIAAAARSAKAAPAKSPAQMLRDRVRALGVYAKLKMTIGSVTVDVALRTRLVGFIVCNDAGDTPALKDERDFLKRCGWKLLAVAESEVETTDLSWLQSMPEKTMREFRSSIGKGSALRGYQMQRQSRNSGQPEKEPPRKEAIKPQPRNERYVVAQPAAAGAVEEAPF